jgi:hypothetical protein
MASHILGLTLETNLSDKQRNVFSTETLIRTTVHAMISTYSQNASMLTGKCVMHQRANIGGS